MVKTTFVSASVLNAFKSLIGNDAQAMRDILAAHNRIPDRVVGAIAEDWIDEHHDAIKDIVDSDINYALGDDIENPSSAMEYAIDVVNNAVCSITGWERGTTGRIVEVLGLNGCDSESMFIFTSPVSNTIWDTYIVWADSINEAHEDLTDAVNDEETMELISWCNVFEIKAQ